MSLDQFQLPPLVAGELYKNVLVELDKNINMPKPLETSAIAYLGNYRKRILVIVDQENATFLEDKDLAFFIDIITACKLSLDDVGVVNFSSSPGLNYKRIQDSLQPSVILCLGVEPSALKFPLEFPHYQVQAYNHQSYLVAPSLQKLAADKGEKLLLWGCLKKLFLT